MSGTNAPEGIVNPIKKITGQTTHKRRVIFNDTTEVMKYSPETGQNLSFMNQRLTDNVKSYALGKAKSALVEHVSTTGAAEEHSIADIGIEEISTGTIDATALGIIL